MESIINTLAAFWIGGLILLLLIATVFTWFIVINDIRFMFTGKSWITFGKKKRTKSLSKKKVAVHFPISYSKAEVISKPSNKA